MRVEHYSMHVEVWPGEEPVATFTVHDADGSYRVVPVVDLGPFDAITDVMRRAAKMLDTQLVLW